MIVITTNANVTQIFLNTLLMKAFVSADDILCICNTLLVDDKCDNVYLFADRDREIVCQ